MKRAPGAFAALLALVGFFVGVAAGHVQTPPMQVCPAIMLQTVPQCPQFRGSAPRSTHMPLQEVNGGMQLTVQTPFVHVWPTGQQVEPQAVVPPVHVVMLQLAGGHSVLHWPPRQTWPDPQVLPQPPQLSGSIEVTAQIEPQRFRPSSHCFFSRCFSSSSSSS